MQTVDSPLQFVVQCSCCACIVIILSFPLLVWPSLQPSQPWWTTTSATTTWVQWSLSQCTRHPRSPRPGTRQFHATCWGRKTSQGRLQAGSPMNDFAPIHYTHIGSMTVGLKNTAHILLVDRSRRPFCDFAVVVMSEETRLWNKIG